MTFKTQWIQDELDGLRQAGLFNTIRTLESPQGAWLTVDGQRVLNFCSNNYLGLANHPRLIDAARRALDCRDDGSAPRPRAAAGRLQGRRGGDYLPVGLQRQPGDDPGPGREGRR